MKTRNLFIGLFVALTAIVFTSCEDNNIEQETVDYGILPERFKVDVPSSISSDLKSSSTKSTQDDTLAGNAIYEHLTNFIAIGEGAGDIAEAIIWSIATYNIDQVKLLTYISDDDNREKKLVVDSDVDFDGRAWEYQLTINDVLLESAEDGGIGMQVFWNKGTLEGIALIKPANLEVDGDSEVGDAIFSIEYSETDSYGYDAYMIVQIADLPVDEDPFAVDALKMFVGKKGDMVDVYGNSNHPNAQFNYHNEETGFNWAFVASGHDTKDIGIAEVGLPSSSADITSRTAILEDNSILSVLTNEMTDYIVEEYDAVGITLSPEEVADYISPYLQNAEAPGYFDNQGFVQAAESPSTDYTELEDRILDLTPYNPKSISELSISFK